MLKIVCVKIGQAYTHRDVNRLLRICKKYISIPFQFFCYTEDGTDLDKDVTVIPFVDNDIDVIVHNKLFLFSDYVEDALGDGDRVFFDLDMVFCDNIDHVVTHNNTHLTLIKAAWRTPVHKGFPQYQHDLNSSCMTWRRGHETKYIWEDYCDRMDLYQLMFHMGMDPYLYYVFYTNQLSTIKISTFPMGMFRSHLWGFDYKQNTPVEGSVNGRYEYDKVAEQALAHPIIVMNGPTTQEDHDKYDAIYSV